MKPEFLKHFPSWMFLLAFGALLVLLGSATEAKLGQNSVRILSPPYNIPVIAVGALLIVVALWQSRKRGEADTHGITKVEITSIDLDRRGTSVGARVSGRIEPARSGIRVWIVREDVAHTTGRFHPGHKAALTDSYGEWQQSTHLWPTGALRIYAVVGSQAESLFSYYRKAYDHARSVYKAKVDATADSFPDWPPLEELPKDCVLDSKTVKV